MSIDNLRDLDRSAITEAAAGWSKVSNRADAAMRRVNHEMLRRLNETQQGEGADSAISALKQLSRNYEYIHAECGLIRTALDGLADELAAPQRKLREALDEAQQRGFTVGSDGSVTYPGEMLYGPDPGGAGSGERAPSGPEQGPPFLGSSGKDPNRAKAQDIADRIGSALKEAAEIDGRYSRALARLTTARGLTVDDAVWRDAAQDMAALRKAAGAHVKLSGVPKGASPQRNAAWWKGLTQEQRDEYTALYPDVIGALNGIPSDARDSANRLVLAETRSTLASTLASLPENDANKLQRKLIEGQLKGMEAIQNRLDSAGVDGMPDRYLLAFDTRGNGHAIVATGNPDTAQNTAVYIPGTHAKLESINGDLNRSDLLWRKSLKVDPNRSTATIAYLGYDAPQSIAPSAMSRSYADHGAAGLNNFMAGLAVAQGGDDKSHTTLIGHSYGTTLIGSAARHGHLSGDDVVLVGSPGVEVGNAKDLDVGKKHVWSEAAGDDRIPLLGKVFTGLPGREFTVDTWHGVPYYAGWSAEVPSDEAFGAHRMRVDTSGHGGYWDTYPNHDSESLLNQARVITEHYGKVT
ncbi:alpha/beta hydrolase [Streptomyces sp. B1866]|uniref:alpha/beta hydrolase n=1 Tax=Streptomyces sp. B1866 TaxID=3075431 RepID=UPI0028912394|nr:alpha/beta hydrolase [Streptomyces sp. B1866]MDT3398758.1 alpha/beta hydrolase [Streptomyces sp. B1866]